MAPRLAVVGLDGATFDVIKPLCDEGRLPVLQELLSKGAHAVLESTFPPSTGPAWAALATGKNPGKTGVFDTLIPTDDSGLHTRRLSSHDIRRARPFWDILGEAGLRVGVVNYPFLYPPYQINGVMVSGLGSDPNDQICYPPSFCQSLLDRCGEYRIGIPWNRPEYASRPGLFARHILHLLEVNRHTLDLLLQSDLDVLVFVISASDFVQHFMWDAFDASYPFRGQEANAHRDAFVTVWNRVDQMLGTIVEGVAAEGNIVIVSDHGFGPRLSDFFTNSWLEGQGYLQRKAWLDLARRCQSIAAEAVRGVAPRLHHRLSKAAEKDRLPAVKAASEIQLRRTRAFAPPNASLAGKICINRASLLRTGALDGLDVLREEIAQQLHDSCGSLGLEVSVYLPSDLYSGPYVNLAPDVLFEIERGACTVRLGFDRRFYRSPPRNPRHTGSHRREGVLIAYGRNVKDGHTLPKAQIYDVAPTILCLCGLPVPPDLDGDVVTGMLKQRRPQQRSERMLQAQADHAKGSIRHKVRNLRNTNRV
jgi:predicted AlkP superfamily phosphohydrolase/phosphomutase